jgi:hypothetical protein
MRKIPLSKVVDEIVRNYTVSLPLIDRLYTIESVTDLYELLGENGLSEIDAADLIIRLIIDETK